MSDLVTNDMQGTGRDERREAREGVRQEPRATDSAERELRRHSLGGLLVSGSGMPRLRAKCLALSFRLEGGQHFSHSAREILRVRCGVQIGAYSYGHCFVPFAFPPGVVVGRYVSIADGVNIFTRNHPMNTLSTHPFFFNSCLGVIEKDAVAYGPFEIAADAWVGANAIFTPGCKRVGLGAVVGAGSVVTKDVPDFAVVVGNPAKIIKMRFGEETCEAIRASQWWEKSLNECREVVPAMMSSVEDWRKHPLLGGRREERRTQSSQSDGEKPSWS